jgi:hypothetical protein
MEADLIGVAIDIPPPPVRYEWPDRHIIPSPVHDPRMIDADCSAMMHQAPKVVGSRVTPHEPDGLKVRKIVSLHTELNDDWKRTGIP